MAKECFEGALDCNHWYANTNQRMSFHPRVITPELKTGQKTTANESYKQTEKSKQPCSHAPESSSNIQAKWKNNIVLKTYEYP